MAASWVVKAADNFDRADERPLGNGVWTTPPGSPGGMAAVSNQCTYNTQSSDDESRYSGRAWSPDHASRAGLSTTDTSAEIGPALIVRWSSTERTGYRLCVNKAATNNATIRRFLSPSDALVVQFTQAWTSFDIWELRASGPSNGTFLEVLRNGVTVGTFTDNSTVPAGGSPGVAYSSLEASAVLDSWEGLEPSSALDYSRFPKFILRR